MCFLLWPLFARAPCHWFLEFLLLSSLGVQSVFVFVAPRWVPRPFGGARAKKHTTQKTTHHPGCVFFCSGPGERQGKEKPRWAPARGHRQKKTPWDSLTAGLGGDASRRDGVFFFFFAAAPPGPGWCFFFLLWPRPDAHSLTCFFFFAAAPPNPARQ